MLAVGEQSVIKTVDYVSGQSAQWLLTAVVFVFGGAALFFMRRMLADAAEVKKDFKTLDAKYDALKDKHMDELMVYSATAAENALRVTSFAEAVMKALDASTGVIRGTQTAMDANTEATKQGAKSSAATTDALIDLKNLGEKTTAEVRRRADDTDDFIRKNTRALEDRDRKRDGS